MTTTARSPILFSLTSTMIAALVSACVLVGCGNGSSSSSSSSSADKPTPMFKLKREGLESLSDYRPLIFSAPYDPAHDGRESVNRLAMIYFTRASAADIDVAKALIPEVANENDPFKAKDLAEKAMPMIKPGLKEAKHELYYTDICTNSECGSSAHYNPTAKSFKPIFMGPDGDGYHLPGDRTTVRFSMYGNSGEWAYQPKNEDEARAIEAELGKLQPEGNRVKGIVRVYFRVMGTSAPRMNFNTRDVEKRLHVMFHGISFLNPQTKAVIYTINAKSQELAAHEHDKVPPAE